MKKRLLSLALSFVMLLTMLPVSVWAEEDEATAVTTVTTEFVESVTNVGQADNDELLMGYLYQAAVTPQEALPYQPLNTAPSSDYIVVSHRAAMGAVPSNDLTETERRVYTALREAVAKIAKGDEASSIIEINLEDATYTAEDIGATNFDDKADQDLAFRRYSQEQVPDVTKLINVLMAETPYELYWYDKEMGARASTSLWMSGSTTSTTVGGKMVIYMSVAQEYATGGYVVLNTESGEETILIEVDSSTIDAVNTAINKAHIIVESYINQSDYSKLKGYLDEVMGLTVYNEAASEPANNTPYGNPWQLIWVFDGNPNTNVVCEGYAKAFKYLCDLTEWNDASFSCVLATGKMGGGTGAGDHMWNIVHMKDANHPNGASFLVDPTNCDEDMVGHDYGLFLRGNSTSEYVERTNEITGDSYNSLTYTFTFDNDQSIFFGYDDDTQALYGSDYLTLAAQDYVEPVIDQSTGLRYREVTDSEWVDDGESGYYLAQVDAEIRSDLALYADREIDVQIGFLNSDGTFTVLSADDLTVSGDIELNAQDMRDEEDRPCLWLVPIAPYADGAITYHNEADGKDYTMNVPVRLPDVGFYSEAQPDKGHYIEELVYKNDPDHDVVYLFWPADAALISVEKAERCTVDYVIENKDSMAKDGYARILLKSYGDGYVGFDVNYQQAGKEPASGYGYLSLKMGTPALGFKHAWNQNGEMQTGEAQFQLSMTVGYFSVIQLFYFDGETTYTPVSAEELQFEGVTLTKLAGSDESNAYYRINLTGTDNGSISYRKDDKTYTLPVTVQLPDVGFYRSDTATKKNYLTSYKYTGNEDVVYLFWPTDATLISVEESEWCSVDYEIQNETNMAEDGYARILLKSFGGGYVAFNVKYQQGDEEPSDDSVSLSLQLGTPCLGYRHLAWDSDSNKFYPLEDVYYNLSLTAAKYSPIQVVFYDGEDDYTPVSLEKLQFEGIEAEKEEYDNTYLLIKSEGANDGSITYHNEADDTDYTMKVSVQLPDVGYYSSNTATKETYLSSFDYKGDNNVVYLVWPSDATLNSLENTRWCTAEYEIQNKDKMEEDHYAAISLHISGDSILSLHVSLSYPNSDEPIDDYFDLTIRDVSPGLRMVSDWDAEKNQPAADARVTTSITLELYRDVITQLAFFDGETYRLLGADEVTPTNASVSQYGDSYLEVSAFGSDDGSISYLNPDDGKPYTMEIRVKLPDVWYYSSPEASEETYLRNWVYDGTDNTRTIYLVATNGYQITESPTLLDGSRAAEYTISEDGTYVTIQLTGAQDDFAESLRFSASLRNGSLQATRNLYFTIYYSNLTANLELPQNIEETGYLVKAVLRDKNGQLVDVGGWNINRNQVAFLYKAPGEYLLEITWSGCVTRTVPVTVEEGKAASVSVALLQRGNVNAADGTNIFDMQCLFEYLSQGTIVEAMADDKTYFRAVADVNDDGAVNILDYQTLYELLKPNEMTA